jgi:hypothetical protein
VKSILLARALLVSSLVVTTSIAANGDTPTETVIVTAGTLTGVWKIAKPHQVTKDGFFGAIKWGPLGDYYCRIERQQDGLISACLAGGQAGTVTVDGAHIHFAQGTMMARLVLDGTLRSPTHFQGFMEAKLAGISVTDTKFSTGDKLIVTPDAPDKGGKAGLLRSILTDGVASVPSDDVAIRKAVSGSGQIPKLGAIQAIAYLGQQTLLGRPNVSEDQVDYFAVYAVEFDSGERICGLHQRADGVLDAFLCV